MCWEPMHNMLSTNKITQAALKICIYYVIHELFIIFKKCAYF